MIVLGATVGLAGGVASTLIAGAGGKEPVDPLATDLENRYWEHVEPLLARYCFGCHGEDAAKGGVRFDRIWSLADALAMGDELALAGELVS